MESIDTKRLRLRQWKESDFDNFARYYADEDNARCVGGQKDPEKAWRHMALQIGHWKLKGFGYRAVDEKDTSAFIGSVGLWQSPGWPELELGYWLVKKHQGRGYAMEACLRCIEFARNVPNAPSLVSYVDPGNDASIRLAKRLGAVHADTIELLSYGKHHVFRHF